MSQTLQCKKKTKNTNFNGNLSMKLCTNKETTIMNNLPHQKFQCHKIKKFTLNDMKIFGSTLGYCNVDDYNIFKL